MEQPVFIQFLMQVSWSRFCLTKDTAAIQSCFLDSDRFMVCFVFMAVSNPALFQKTSCTLNLSKISCERRSPVPRFCRPLVLSAYRIIYKRLELMRSDFQTVYKTFVP